MTDKDDVDLAKWGYMLEWYRWRLARVLRQFRNYKPRRQP